MIFTEKGCLRKKDSFPFLAQDFHHYCYRESRLRVAFERSLLCYISWGGSPRLDVLSPFKMASIFDVVSLKLVEVTPFSRFMTHNIRLWSLMHRNIIQVDNFVSYLLAMSFQGRRALHEFSTLLKHCLFLYKWGVTSLLRVLWAFGIRNVLFHVTCLLLGITFLALYITFTYVTIFASEDVGRGASDSLKCPALNAHMNFCWSEWMNFIVA